jgi:hypothetical protein
MKKLLLPAFIFSVMLLSCSSNDKKVPQIPTDNTAAPATPSNTNGQTAVGTQADSPNPLKQEGFTYPAKPANNTAVPTNQPVTQKVTTPVTMPEVKPVATTPTTTAKGMNPPHGQPGHRCDISVGAPLDSKPTAAPTPTPVNVQQPKQVVTNQPVTMEPTKPSAPVVTLPGMNPPHGQPGHRCDISVGAPLNSAPAKKDSV